MRIIRQIPNALTISRFFIAAFLVLDAKNGYASKYFLPLFIFAGFSDFLDGFIARKMKATTSHGCVLDGYADIALSVGAFLSAYWLYPAIIKKYIWGVVILLFLQIASWVFSIIKFSRMTSYHTYSAKIWGIAIFISLGIVFAFSNGSLLLLMLLVGILSNIDEIVITAVMPYWRGEISNFNMALRLRNEYKRS